MNNLDTNFYIEREELSPQEINYLLESNIEPPLTWEIDFPDNVFFSANDFILVPKDFLND